jgi:TonB-dependent SusC/RagA subfamily outer membrane receptor
VAQAGELLAGRFPGVQVMRVPGGISIRIRGGASAFGNNEPLFVVDGLQIQAGPGGALAGINPMDIARIEVLKDSASLATYGVRGANGVVLITTRRGAR